MSSYRAVRTGRGLISNVASDLDDLTRATRQEVRMPGDVTKFDNGECTKLQKESLKCLMDNNGRREACSEFFERYRACTKERMERLQAEKRQRYAQ